MKREFEFQIKVGTPRLNEREKITKKVNFDYIHKKQPDDTRQYAKVIGYSGPIDREMRKIRDGFSLGKMLRQAMELEV